MCIRDSTYTLFIEPRLVTDEQWPALRDRLAGLMQLDPQGLDQARERGAGKDGYRIPLVNGLQPEQVLRFQEQNLDLPGASVDMDILRFYPHGMLASHTLGYTQPITEDEYEVLIDKGYKLSLIHI